ncbi:hypothetical protein [Nostoc sp. CHAB 5836]|nr:hypothetical protein [Nostoc sp. CHAB 5836]
MQHIPISLVFAYGIDGQDQIILSENFADFRDTLKERSHWQPL